MTTNSPRPTPKKKVVVDYESDIDPDDLLPIYLETKTKLFEREGRLGVSNGIKSRPNGSQQKSRPVSDPEVRKLQRKLKKIENDVLFDQYIADQRWETERIELEKNAAAQRVADRQQASNAQVPEDSEDSGDEVMKEAAKMAAELLEETGSDDDAALADLFASLPVNEVDPTTGKSNTVLNGTNGVKITIRDFGKWTGLSPQRVLEEACRSRDAGARLLYTTISDSNFAQRHALKISWSKPQDISELDVPSGVDLQTSKKQLTFVMSSIAAPDSKQSEAYIATIALFAVFASSSSKEDKVALRLPPAWRDLWAELAEHKKEKIDAEDRESLRIYRDMVRSKRDQELDDGVLLQSAFRNRGTGRALDNVEIGQITDGQSSLPAEFYQRIWQEKSSTSSYQAMLVSGNDSLRMGCQLTLSSHPECSCRCGVSRLNY